MVLTVAPEDVHAFVQSPCMADPEVFFLQRAARANKKELRVKYKHDHCLNQKAAAGNLLSPAIAM